MAQTNNIRYGLLKVVVFLQFVEYMEMKRQCIKGMTTPGYTIPSDDIVINYGNPLDITCFLNEEYQKQHPNISSEDLYFERGGEIIQHDKVTVLNSSSIYLHIEQPEISEWVYNCKLKNVGVCLNTVYVGTAPVFVDDFNCTGINYENLTCSWTILYNPVPTSYNLRYYTGAQNHRHLSNDCPNLQKLNNRRSCTWTLTSQPPYKQSQEDIQFVLTAVNELGTAQLNKSISHFKRVIPAQPENLTIINVTSDSITLKWTVPFEIQLFPPGLQHRIIYKTEFDKNEWHLASILYSSPRNKTKRLSYNLTNLTYAFAEYEIGIAIRSAVADPNDNNMWSKYTYTTVRTKGRVPGRPPATTIGGFETVNTGNTLHKLRDVYVYWQQIPERQKNGKHFVYEVEVQTNNTLKPVELTSAYAKFSNLRVDEEYIFKIWSSNIFGRSENFSVVTVTNRTKDAVAPAHFTKLIREDHTYELSWDDLTYPVSNFTIFACLFERDRPYQCAGRLFWKVISPTNANYIVSTPEPKRIYQFAISANSDDFTSGMIWADCTVISNQIGNKLKSVWVHQTGTTFIILNWKLDCSERIGGTQGFAVRYCDYRSFYNGNCEWSELNFNGLNVEQANITGLLPYRKYVFQVVKITKSGELRQKSDYLFDTTHEAAPTPPTHVGVANTTNSSVSIFWREPLFVNGRINHYVILGKNHIYKVNATARQFTLYNLTSYTDYNFSIFACTVACSGPSPTLTVRTQGGYPSRIGQPGVTFQNDSFTLVEWEHPKYPNGDCDIYEIHFKEKRRYENKTLTIINTTETWYVIENCGNGGIYNTFFISVRAVNILNGTRYEGPWSDELQSFCRDVTTNAWLWALGPALLLLVVLVYLGRRMYYNFQKMSDIEVKLPPGLETFSNEGNTLDSQKQVIEEVPLKENAVVNTSKYMAAPKLSDNTINSHSCTVYTTIGVDTEEYAKMGSSNTIIESNEVRYVQVGDLTLPQKRNSIVLVANRVPMTTGYVTVSDILSTRKS